MLDLVSNTWFRFKKIKVSTKAHIQHLRNGR
jgi:hypothetical protein